MMKIHLAIANKHCKLCANRQTIYAHLLGCPDTISGFFRAKKLNLVLSFETKPPQQKFVCSKNELFELNVVT